MLIDRNSIQNKARMRRAGRGARTGDMLIVSVTIRFRFDISRTNVKHTASMLCLCSEWSLVGVECVD